MPTDYTYPHKNLFAALVIPAVDDPLKLLGDPESVAWKCGARPPVAHASQSYHREEGTFGTAWSEWRLGRGKPMPRRKDDGRPWPMHPWYRWQALIIGWDGEFVMEGAEVAERVFRVKTPRDPLVGSALLFRGAKEGDQHAFGSLVRQLSDLGTVVVLNGLRSWDARRVDIDEILAEVTHV